MWTPQGVYSVAAYGVMKFKGSIDAKGSCRRFHRVALEQPSVSCRFIASRVVHIEGQHPKRLATLKRGRLYNDVASPSWANKKSRYRKF